MSTNNAEGGDELPPGFGVVRARPQRKTEKTMLPVDYEPSKYSIICGRGKGSYQSDGNVNFRHLVKSNLERYKEAPGRLEKSFIVSEVLAMIRESCPVGAFVKYENGRWYDLDDTVCREKVGSLFRDFLHTEYKSSSKAKHARKVAEKNPEGKKKSGKKPTGKAEKEQPPSPTPTSSPQQTPRKPTSLAPTPTAVVPTSSLLPRKLGVQLGALSQRQPQQYREHRTSSSKQRQVAGGEAVEDRPKFYDIDDLSLAKLE